MCIRKPLVAVSLSFLLLISQAGCGGGGSSPAAGSAVSAGNETGSGTGNTAEQGGGATAGTAAPSGTAPTGGPAADGTTTAGGSTATGGSTTTGGAGAALATGVANLSWDASQTGVTGYKVYYGTSSKSYTSKVDVGMVSSYTVSNLPSGTYYFAVTAYDSTGNESTYSNEGSKTIS
jgi:hypothetical protein